MPPIDAVSLIVSRRGARDLGNDGAVLLQQSIEEAALAHVGPSDDRQHQPLLHQATVAEARDQLIDARLDGCEAARDLIGRRYCDIVLGEIDAGLQQQNQLQELLFDRSDAARYAASGLLHRDPRLEERGGFDQVAHGLRLRQVEPAVQKGSHGELARFGETRSGSHRALDRVAQHHRRSMAGDLDHVLRRERMRGVRKTSRSPGRPRVPSHREVRQAAWSRGRQVSGDRN